MDDVFADGSEGAGVTAVRRLWFLLRCGLHLVARLVAGAVALARDLCETAYASYPAEDGDELL